MFVIGVTGGIGCGKSTVAALMGEAGLPIIDADQLSHQVCAQGGSALPEITSHFGEHVLIKDQTGHLGGLDRKKMAEIVFQNKPILDQLSSIIHKYVILEIQKILKKYQAEKVKACVLDVPIPVQHGFLDRCDIVYSVWTDADIRKDRLLARGMTAVEIKRRLSMQMTREEYASFAQAEIENSQDKEILREKIQNILTTQLTPRGIHFQSLIKT